MGSGLQENGESRRNVECSCSVLHCFLYYNQRFCIRLQSSSFPSSHHLLVPRSEMKKSQETIKLIHGVGEMSSTFNQSRWHYIGQSSCFSWSQGRVEIQTQRGCTMTSCPIIIN